MLHKFATLWAHLPTAFDRVMMATLATLAAFSAVLAVGMIVEIIREVM
jgi:hypothetical protein